MRGRVGNVPNRHKGFLRIVSCSPYSQRISLHPAMSMLCSTARSERSSVTMLCNSWIQLENRVQHSIHVVTRRWPHHTERVDGLSTPYLELHPYALGSTRFPFGAILLLLLLSICVSHSFLWCSPCLSSSAHHISAVKPFTPVDLR